MIGSIIVAFIGAVIVVWVIRLIKKACVLLLTLQASRRTVEAADAGLLSPELAAGIRRVKGAKKLGVRLGNWLTAEEARRFWQSPAPNTLKGKMDRAILALNTETINSKIPKDE
jgi:hypothetical protein